jgi:hypothetical protein
MDVETVVPDPETMAAESDRYVYTVRIAGSDATITIRTRPSLVGWIDGELGVVGGPTVRLHQTSLF